MKLLLHVCCGPCAAHLAKELAREHDVALFFYNPNVWPREEYEKRLDAARQLAKAAGLNLVVGEYDDSTWNEAVLGLENEPEGGRRCEVCFGFRLRETARRAAAGGFDAFATTLSVSPHKDTATINRIGVQLADTVSAGSVCGRGERRIDKSPLAKGDLGGCLLESPLAKVDSAGGPSKSPLAKGDSGGCLSPVGARHIAAVCAPVGTDMSLRAAAKQSHPLQFLAEDFKKRDGFRKSLDACREFRLYRQQYCGCKYSLPSQADLLMFA